MEGSGGRPKEKYGFSEFGLEPPDYKFLSLTVSGRILGRSEGDWLPTGDLSHDILVSLSPKKDLRYSARVCSIDTTTIQLFQNLDKSTQFCIYVIGS